MQPETFALPRRRRSPRPGRTTSTRWCRPSRRSAIGTVAGGAIRRDRLLERVDPHRRTDRRRRRGRRRRGPMPSVIARLLDRGMGLGRGVDAQPRHARGGRRARRSRRRRPATCRAAARPSSAGGRGGVGDQAVEPLGQPEALAQPVDDDLLELRRDRRRPPEHGVGAERCGQELAEHARPGCGRREVGHEARMLPVRHVRLDQALDVAQDLRAAVRVRAEVRPGTAAAASPARPAGRRERLDAGRGSRR